MRLTAAVMLLGASCVACASDTTLPGDRQGTSDDGGSHDSGAACAPSSPFSIGLYMRGSERVFYSGVARIEAWFPALELVLPDGTRHSVSGTLRGVSWAAAPATSTVTVELFREPRVAGLQEISVVVTTAEVPARQIAAWSRFEAAPTLAGTSVSYTPNACAWSTPVCSFVELTAHHPRLPGGLEPRQLHQAPDLVMLNDGSRATANGSPCVDEPPRWMFGYAEVIGL